MTINWWNVGAYCCGSTIITIHYDLADMLSGGWVATVVLLAAMMALTQLGAGKRF